VTLPTTLEKKKTCNIYLVVHHEHVGKSESFEHNPLEEFKIRALHAERHQVTTLSNERSRATEFAFSFCPDFQAGPRLLAAGAYPCYNLGAKPPVQAPLVA
jgi:hypothetical protein